MINPFKIILVQSSHYNELIEALDHIERVAGQGRTTTRRMRWIQYRAKCARTGEGNWRDMPSPNNRKPKGVEPTAEEE